MMALSAPLPAPEAALESFKDWLAQGRHLLEERFRAGESAARLVRDHAQMVDELLGAAWVRSGLAGAPAALVAVGGYGRGELHPGSDVDICILLGAGTAETLRPHIESFIAFLWDTGLEVGHSVRTVEECREEAARDITVATGLMEARLLGGDARLFEAMRERTGPQNVWPSAEFFAAKLAEQVARHQKFNDTVENLEPNIKEGPGGLRDIQVIGWVAKRHFGTATLQGLLEHGFLTDEEFTTLDNGKLFLWRIRWGLHALSGRREDRLLFDYQRAIAELFGFRDPEGGNRGIEQFMKLFYRTLLELRRLNEMLLELFEEAILHAEAPAVIKPLNKRFQIRNGYIEVRDPGVFRRHPYALLELFLLVQQNPEIEGVRASTIRLVRDHRHLIDETFRKDLRARSLFMEIFRRPRQLGHELERMHRYGVLEAYLPAFAAVVGLMQFDLFHVYTVDEHTLVVVRNLHRFACPDPAERMPLAEEIMAQLPKPELLYIAGFFHDIAKGRGGDHSELGEQEAAAFCRNHGLGEWDTKLVAWLVRNHLLMSRTASRMDLSDPEVIHNFAGLLGDRTHLDYLYLLTVADIRGTNPKLWTAWKDALLGELYFATLHALRRGLENPIQRAERIAEVQGEALALLCQKRLDKHAVQALWATLPADYFLRHTPEEVAWHAEVILARGDEGEPLLLIRTETHRGGTAIFLYTRDQDSLFAITTQAMDQLGLTIQDARIITSQSGYVLNTYIVLEADTGAAVQGEQRVREIAAGITRALASGTLNPKAARPASRKLRQFRIPTSVSFADDPSGTRTMMEVVTTDRPGVLWRIANAMRFCGVRLHNARIATFGERVEDIFFLTDRNNQPIRDALTFECLRNSITAALTTD